MGKEAMSDANGSDKQSSEPNKKSRLEKFRFAYPPMGKKWLDTKSKFRFIHNSPLGKKWQAYKANLATTEQGRRKLKGIRILNGLAWLALFIWFKIFGYDFLYPADYHLTEKQQGEGYSRTISSSFRNSHPEDIYFRFYEDDEMDLPDCASSSDWCVFAIPLSKNCSEITMDFSTHETDGNSEVIEEFHISVSSKSGLPFVLGQRATLNIKSKDEKSIYGSVDHIYCSNN